MIDYSFRIASDIANYYDLKPKTDAILKLQNKKTARARTVIPTRTIELKTKVVCISVAKILNTFLPNLPSK